MKRSKKPSASGNLNQMKARMLSDSSFRNQMASSYGVSRGSTSKSNAYSAIGNPTDRIEFDGNFYTRTLSSGEKQKFDRQGKLSYIYFTPKNYIKISHQGGNISSIALISSHNVLLMGTESGKMLMSY